MIKAYAILFYFYPIELALNHPLLLLPPLIQYL